MPVDLPLIIAAALGALAVIALLALRQAIIGVQQRQREQDAAVLERLTALAAALDGSERRAQADTDQLRQLLLDQLGQARNQTQTQLHQLSDRFGDLRTAIERRLGELQTQTLNQLASGASKLGDDVAKALTRSTEQLTQRVDKLTETTDQRLKDISGQVDTRLKEGFEKTTTTFSEVIKRLALIDEAQKRITELSTNVVSLQDVLADKRARGAFGEVQLEALVRNVLPDQHISLQHTLPGNVRVDCLLRLPPPTGDVCIDAKFPLESYQTMTDRAVAQSDRQSASRQFAQDVKKHIKDIANKYIIPEVTAPGAIMFVPAEAVFAEIHAHHSDLVRQAQDLNVWICSPSTLVAVLTTARAVLRDDALRQQAHVIRAHLVQLNREFGRFRERMDKLARHIESAHEETRKVHITASKISRQFARIEQAHDDSPAVDDDSDTPLAALAESLEDAEDAEDVAADS